MITISFLLFSSLLWGTKLFVNTMKNKQYHNVVIVQKYNKQYHNVVIVPKYNKQYHNVVIVQKYNRKNMVLV